MNNPQNEKNSEAICPHLGLPSDPLTAMSYPSSQNFCRHVTPSAAPGSEHQRKFCLAASFAQCKLFAAKTTKQMPAAFLAEQIIIRKETHGLRWLIVVFVILAVIAVALVLTVTRALPAALVRTPTAPQPTLTTPAAAVAAETIFTITHTPQLSATVNLSPTLTPTPQPPHLLETPFGTQRQFLVHRVLEGESLNLLANTFHTSVEAIRAVNYNLPGTLWGNTVLVIPLNQTDVTGVTPMTVYAINSEGISIQALALEQGVTLEALCELNDLPDNYLFHTGEWVILPHTQPTP